MLCGNFKNPRGFFPLFLKRIPLFFFPGIKNLAVLEICVAN